MKVDIISRKPIRPSSPTPPHLKNFKLSLLDQSFPPNFYGNMIFFYSRSLNTNHVNPNSAQLLASRLRKSLSKTLVHFYPFAGRFKGAASIDCNDEGAYFAEANINCHLLSFLSKPEANFLHHFIPTCSDTFGVVLLAQITLFECGGIAFGVSLSHKVGDGSSLCTFVQTWTATARELQHDREWQQRRPRSLLPPYFIGASLLPASDRLPITSIFDIPSQNLTTKRFVFSASKMATLKAQTTSTLQRLHKCGPTNVELVSALVLKSAMRAASRQSPIPKPSLVFNLVNLRKRMVPPLPENAIGNLVLSFPVLIHKNVDLKLHELVFKMKTGLADFCSDVANRFRGEDGFHEVCEALRKEGELSKNLGGEINVFRCVSLCKLPFYEMDFGCGNPIWVTCPIYFRNSIRLVGTKCGEDIEAWVTLQKQEMDLFERDEMLLSIASLNPSVSTLSHCRM